MGLPFIEKCTSIVPNPLIPRILRFISNQTFWGVDSCVRYNKQVWYKIEELKPNPKLFSKPNLWGFGLNACLSCKYSLMDVLFTLYLFEFSIPSIKVKKILYLVILLVNLDFLAALFKGISTKFWFYNALFIIGASSRQSLANQKHRQIIKTFRTVKYRNVCENVVNQSDCSVKQLKKLVKDYVWLKWLLRMMLKVFDRSLHFLKFHFKDFSIASFLSNLSVLVLACT